jgi:O-antigen ligase
MAVSPAASGVTISLYLIGWLALHRSEMNWPWVLRGPVLAIAGIAILGAISAAWALDPARSVSRAWKVVLVMAPLALFARCAAGRGMAHTPFNARALLIGLTFTGVLLVWQAEGEFLLRAWRAIDPHVVATKLNVPIGALAILIFVVPACVCANGSSTKWLFVATVAVALVSFAIISGDGLAPRVALLAGAAVWLSARYLPRMTAIGIVLSVILFHIAILVVTPNLYRDTRTNAQITDPSIRHRIDVWDMTGELIRQRPLLGYGMDNSRSIPGRAEISTATGAPRAIPLYPHNVLLQVQLELGMFGVLGFYVGLVYLVRRSLAMNRVGSASALAMIAAALSIWCVGYPLWRSTWITWLGFCAVAICVIAPPQNDAASDRRAAHS